MQVSEQVNDLRSRIDGIRHQVLPSFFERDTDSDDCVGCITCRLKARAVPAPGAPGGKCKFDHPSIRELRRSRSHYCIHYWSNVWRVESFSQHKASIQACDCVYLSASRCHYSGQLLCPQVAWWQVEYEWNLDGEHLRSGSCDSAI